MLVTRNLNEIRCESREERQRKFILDVGQLAVSLLADRLTGYADLRERFNTSDVNALRRLHAQFEHRERGHKEEIMVSPRELSNPYIEQAGAVDVLQRHLKAQGALVELAQALPGE